MRATDRLLVRVRDFDNSDSKTVKTILLENCTVMQPSYTGMITCKGFTDFTHQFTVDDVAVLYDG